MDTASNASKMKLAQKVIKSGAQRFQPQSLNRVQAHCCQNLVWCLFLKISLPFRSQINSLEWLKNNHFLAFLPMFRLNSRHSLNNSCQPGQNLHGIFNRLQMQRDRFEVQIVDRLRDQNVRLEVNPIKDTNALKRQD
jgi:hypothetical protein